MINFIAYGICPACPADFKVASECAILDGVITFVNAQTHNLMGIGARIDYDTTENVYVVGKINQSTWIVRNVDGSKPNNTVGNVTCNNITHPFASQAAFEAGFSALLGTNDLTMAEVSLHAVCYCEQTGFTADNNSVAYYDPSVSSETHQFHVYCITDTKTQGNMIHANVNNGIWDANKYRITSGGRTVFVIHCRGNIKFTNIQLYNLSNATDHKYGFITETTAVSKITINRCIIRMAGTSADFHRFGISLTDGYNTTTTVKNCLIYMNGTYAIQDRFRGVNHYGVELVSYIIQNTIYGFKSPVWDNHHAYSHAYNNTYIGNDDATINLLYQDYNVYDVNESETHGTLTAQADNALFTAVAGGRETWDWSPVIGSDLINNAKHFNSHTDDLNNAEGYRYQSIAPDAGAIERGQTVCPFGICPNCPADFTTGSGTLTIVDGIGTFEVPQTHELMGIGAEVTYGGATIAYVKEMTNPFQFALVTGAGAAAPNATDQAINSITHPFASQSAAEAGYAALSGNASLVAGDYQLWFPCYCEQTGYTTDAVAISYDGPTCDYGHWIKVFQTFSTIKESIMQHRVTNQGAWDSTKYRHEMAGDPSVDINNIAGNISNILFIGLQIHNSTAAAGNRTAIAIRGQNGSYAITDSCVVRFSDGSDPRFCFALITNAVTTVTIINSLLIQPEINNATSDGIIVQVNDLLDCYQTGFFRCPEAIDGSAGATINTQNNWFLENIAGNTNLDTSDYNLYREINEGDANGVLTTQTNKRLFNDYNSTTPIDSDWEPKAGSDLINNAYTSTSIAIDFAFMLKGDLDHPFETEWRPKDGRSLNRFDIGPLERPAPLANTRWYTYW